MTVILDAPVVPRRRAPWAPDRPRHAVFLAGSCLLETWPMAKDLVRAAAVGGGPEPERRLRALDAESMRGTDPLAVRRALWAGLAGSSYQRVEELVGGCAGQPVDRVDEIGVRARRILAAHRAAGDTIVVVADLPSFFAGSVARHLQVEHVLCGEPDVDSSGTLTGFTDILLGAAAARTLVRQARRLAVVLERCSAYGCLPGDSMLLAAVPGGGHIAYGRPG